MDWLRGFHAGKAQLPLLQPVQVWKIAGLFGHSTGHRKTTPQGRRESEKTSEIPAHPGVYQKGLIIKEYGMFDNGRND